MAYRTKAEEKPNAFKLIQKDIKSGKMPSLILLCGKEQYIVQWSVNEIINKFVNKATESLDVTYIEEEKFSVDYLIESCETLSMFSEKRVVIISDFSPLESKALKGFLKEDEERLCKYLNNLPSDTILIFTTGELSQDKKKRSSIESKPLYRVIKEQGKIYEFDSLGTSDLKNFIIKRLRDGGKICREVVIEELITMSGYYHKEAEYTLFNLDNDLKKIIAHSKSEEIIVADVLSTISGNIETDIFGMLDALSKGRKDEAYRLLYNLLTKGEPISMLLAMIISQFELILMTKEMRNEGQNQDGIATNLKVHPFRIKKAIDLGRTYSAETLKKILQKAYEVDYNVKTGIMEEKLALELFIAQI